LQDFRNCDRVVRLSAHVAEKPFQHVFCPEIVGLVRVDHAIAIGVDFLEEFGGFAQFLGDFLAAQLPVIIAPPPAAMMMLPKGVRCKSKLGKRQSCDYNRSSRRHGGEIPPQVPMRGAEASYILTPIGSLCIGKKRDFRLQTGFISRGKRAAAA
jgi:hypothetical protein